MLNLFKQEAKIRLQENETIPDAKENLEYIESFNFSKTLEKLKKTIKNKTVVIYGAGVFFQLIQKYYDLTGLNIIGISDKRFYSHDENEQCFGYKVLSIDEVLELQPDYVLVAIKYYIPILEDLYFNKFAKTKINVKPLLKKSFFRLLEEI